LLDDSSSEYVGACKPITAAGSGTTITIYWYWAMESATSGDVMLIGGVKCVADGEDLTASAITGSGLIVTVPGTAKYLEISSDTYSEAWAENDLLRITFRRYGDSGDDDATGDLHFLGAKVVFS
jgi:hypothetical protein